MEEFSNVTHGLMFFIFMIILIILVLAGFVNIFSGMIGRIRAVVQQMINVIFIIYPITIF